MNARRTLDALLSKPPEHVTISQDIDGVNILLPTSNFGLRNAARMTAIIFISSGIAVGFMAAAVYGTGLVTGQMPEPGPMSVHTPSGIALLVAGGLLMLGAFPYVTWLQEQAERLPTWRLSIRPGALVVDGRTVSYGEIEAIDHRRTGGLSLRLDSGDTLRLAQRVIFTAQEREPVRWLHDVLVAAVHANKRPQGSRADVPALLAAVRDR